MICNRGYYFDKFGGPFEPVPNHKRSTAINYLLSKGKQAGLFPPPFLHGHRHRIAIGPITISYWLITNSFGREHLKITAGEYRAKTNEKRWWGGEKTERRREEMFPLCFQPRRISRGRRRQIALGHRIGGKLRHEDRNPPRWRHKAGWLLAKMNPYPSILIPFTIIIISIIIN